MMNQPPKPTREYWWLCRDQTPDELAYFDWMFGGSIEGLNALQQSGMVHPYTCGNSDCRRETGGGVLRATQDGWVCDRCGYKQPISQ